jgi:hypothetical protein
MRLLKLHARTALLTSAITVIVLGAFLAYSSSVVARLLRDEQRARAELQAINLAEQLSRVPTPYDSQTLQRLISLARTSRRGVVGVRVWERTGGAYRDIATVSDESLPKSLPEAVAADLRAGRTARMTLADAGRNGEPLYQALAPIDRATPERLRLSSVWRRRRSSPPAIKSSRCGWPWAACSASRSAFTPCFAIWSIAR